MSYFPDLTQYEYGNVEPGVLNVGWLGAGMDYPRGDTPEDFRETLRRLVEKPILFHRGYHVCEFCAIGEAAKTAPSSFKGSGQIRVQDQNGTWYAAPTMIYHYVVAHGYQPPPAFVAAVRYASAGGTKNAP
jgi:hypothetical protein